MTSNPPRIRTRGSGALPFEATAPCIGEGAGDLGSLYVVVALAQVDVRRHAVSHLSNGDHGWVQVANFLVTGLLVIAGALGCRRAIRSSSGSTWGTALLVVYGLGLLGAGIFEADPGNGYPPGIEAPAEMTSSGLLHFVFGGIGFYALIAGCLVFARRFGQTGRKRLALFSCLTGAGFLAAFAGVASGSPSPAVMIAIYAAVLWIWTWHTIVHMQLLQGLLVGGQAGGGGGGNRTRVPGSLRTERLRV